MLITTLSKVLLHVFWDKVFDFHRVSKTDLKRIEILQPLIVFMIMVALVQFFFYWIVWFKHFIQYNIIFVKLILVLAVSYAYTVLPTLYQYSQHCAGVSVITTG